MLYARPKTKLRLENKITSLTIVGIGSTNVILKCHVPSKLDSWITYMDRTTGNGGGHK